MSETIRRYGAFIDGLAAGMPTRGITLAFGDARKVGGVDLVPVAMVTYGFGAVDESSRLGAGGGAGGMAVPLGAYAVGDGRLQFRPNTIVMLSLLIPIIGTLGMAISTIIKAAKRP